MICQCGHENQHAAKYCGSCGRQLTVADASGESVVTLEGVSKAFSGRQILREVHLTVGVGESVVIVGLSGSGKSVLMEHILGFLHPDAGQIFISGKAICGVSEHELLNIRRNLGMVFQGAALIDSLTVVDNVALPLTVGQAPADQARLEAQKQLRKVGIHETDLLLYPAELSGGMQKRVGLARALITRPKVLLLDEPTTGLDAATSSQISNLIGEVQKQHPEMAAVTITHDYLSAATIADRVLFLDQSTGNIVEVLDHHQINETRARLPDEGESQRAIRDQLEDFFDDVNSVARSGMKPKLISWPAAFAEVMSNAVYTLGEASLLLPQVNTPVVSPRLFARFYDIGYKSLLMTCMSGLFLGMMLAIQIGFALADFNAYSALPKLVGNIVVDKVGPMFAGLLLAGRIGASVSADIGGKRLSRQHDALRAMGISSEQYWLNPIFWAIVCSMPILCLALELSAFVGAYGVSVAKSYVSGAEFWNTLYINLSMSELLFGLIRTVIFGAAISLVAYAKGIQEKRDSEAVGRACTEAVVAASIGVIGIDFVLTFLASVL